MPKKSFIDKTKSVKYQIVHRSQRDPLLADENASKFVLKAVNPSHNLIKVWNLGSNDSPPHKFQRSINNHIFL